MNILFTICGRSGSKGFKNKNLKKMNGVPLVYYTIAAIRAYLDENPTDQADIALNTDSRELELFCEMQSMIRIKHVSRKQSMAGDDSPKVEVIQDTYLTVKHNQSYDLIIDLDITSPLRTRRDIEEAIRVYQSNNEYDVVYSVVPARRSPYFNVVEESKDGFHHLVCRGNLTARQQAPKCYEMNASIYVYNPAMLDRRIDKVLTEYRSGISIMKDYLVLDIDSEDDFKMMEFLHRYFCDCDEDIRLVYTIAKLAWNECSS